MHQDIKTLYAFVIVIVVSIFVCFVQISRVKTDLRAEVLVRTGTVEWLNNNVNDIEIRIAEMSQLVEAISKNLSDSVTTVATLYNEVKSIQINAGQRDQEIDKMLDDHNKAIQDALYQSKNHSHNLILQDKKGRQQTINARPMNKQPQATVK